MPLADPERALSRAAQLGNELAESLTPREALQNSAWEFQDPQDLIFDLTGQKIDIAEDQPDEIQDILNAFEDAYDDYYVEGIVN